MPEATFTFLYGIYYALTWIVPLLMLLVVPVNRKPSSATAWLMLIFLSPLLGLFVFFLIGSPKLPRRRREQQRTLSQLISGAITDARAHPALTRLLDPEVPERFQPLVRLATTLGGLPAFAGNRLELLSGYHDVFHRLAADIDNARAFAHFEFFALSRSDETEPVFAAMERAAARGVRVRVLLDQWSSRRYPGYRAMLARFTSAGIEAHVMLPVRLFAREFSRPDLRNHRKIVVIDGEIGYTGSQNLIRRDYFRRDGILYDELVARITGPVVSQLEGAFVTDWFSETAVLLSPENAPETRLHLAAAGSALCQLLPSGPAFDDENNLKVFTAAIHAARTTLVITCPYFVPDDALMIAITSAAQRGVDVTLINSAVADQFLVHHAQHSYYEQLLHAGVAVYLYRKPILLHAKHVTIDDDVAIIGSSNLDMRSFQLDLEVSLLCYDAGVVADLRRVEQECLRRSDRLHLAAWRERPAATRLFENVARLTAALQ